MNRFHYAILFVIGLVVPLAISQYQSMPGYMDADYYFASGVELAKGNGFTEPYLWNYLDNPKGLPHPSHTYWMPLASIISALGMWITGTTTFAAGRFPFILLSACVPLLTATLAFAISRNRLLAMVSGLLSIFSIYYASFMPIPDNYALFMLFGGLFLLLAPRSERWIPFVLGILSGFLTLARSDGLLWLGLAGLVVMWKATVARLALSKVEVVREIAQTIVNAALLTILGYLIIMGAWHYRNYSLFGSIMPPGSGRLLWLETYNQTFSYPADSITREGFLRAGWSAALGDRLQALSLNAGTLFGVQGGIFLFPFVLVGLWKLRKELRTKIALTGWLILFFVMTFIFPFAGSRGSFLHAGAAFQPYWWVAASIGLNVLIEAGHSRGKLSDQAPLMFQGILVILAVFMTFYIVNLRVLNMWGSDEKRYASVEKMFIKSGYSPQVGVIVGNPPGYYIISGRPAIALPFGDESVILKVAKRYGAGLLVLEANGTFEEIQQLYDNPQSSDAFIYLGEVDEAKLYRIIIED